MIKYGKALGDTSRQEIYSLILSYFGNLVFEKTKNVGDISMYMCRIHSLLNREYRFVILITKLDNFPKGTTFPLGDIKWISLQTRILDDTHSLKEQSYIVKRELMSNTRMNIINRGEESVDYKLDNYPLKVTLLNKKKGSFEYADNGNLVIALETYKTILTFI